VPTGPALTSRIATHAAWIVLSGSGRRVNQVALRLSNWHCRFIDKYGTHVVVGLSVGGQDVVYVKQDGSSALPPAEIKEHLDRLGDQLFTGACVMPPLRCKSKDKLKVEVSIIKIQKNTKKKDQNFYADEMKIDGKR
jgi:hypothetical protein